MRKQTFTTLTVPYPVVDRSRNTKLDGWWVMISYAEKTILERKYHSTREEFIYQGYDGKAFNQKDAEKQAHETLAEKMKEVFGG
jgi:hypothetical protein